MKSELERHLIRLRFPDQTYDPTQEPKLRWQAVLAHLEDMVEQAIAKREADEAAQADKKEAA